MKVNVRFESSSFKEGYSIADNAEIKDQGIRLVIPRDMCRGDYLTISVSKEKVIARIKSNFRTPSLEIPIDDIRDKIDRIHERGSEVEEIIIVLPKGFLFGVPIKWEEEDGRENKD